DWALIKEDLSNHIDEKVTLRIVSSHAPFNTKRDMGYGYLSDICLDCGGYPMWEVDLGNTSVECPFYYPISICNSISFNDSIFTIEDFYLQIVNNGIIYQTITNGSYDPLSGDICFELTKDIIKNLPKKGYDIFTFAKFRNNITDSVFIIKSKSYTPNTLEDLNNDLIVTCCPEVILDTLDLCEPELIDLCGEIDLDSCQIEILNLNLEIFGIDSVSTKVDLTLDSLNSFCFHISDSLISEWEEYCVRIIVELMYYDSTKGDTITIIQEFENNNGDCLLDEECCPDEEPVQFTLNRILCLTGSNYSHATFDIEGSMHLGNLPDGYSYCGEKPVFNGGHIDYTKYHVTSHFIQFSGILHITDTSQLIYNSSTNRYCLTGTLKVCDEFEQECEIDIIICFSTSQPDMCFEMEGLMCMNFIVNTSPYFPQSGNPPIVFGDDVWLTLVLGVPFIDKYIGEGDTCSIDTYWFEVYGVSSTSIPSHDLLHQSVLQKQGNETSGIFQEQLYIPVSDWNSYDYIEVKFWNNCGDTCTAQQIPVVPVPGDGDRAIMEIVEEEVEVTAFPVPFSDEVIINYQLTMEKTEFRVYDSIGRLIDEGLFSNREGEYLLNTRQWSSGWYILEINDPELKDRTLILIKE
nr:T9SS type A sorting domain-containing protein [Saprospiraceae bacterium]